MLRSWPTYLAVLLGTTYANERECRERNRKWHWQFSRGFPARSRADETAGYTGWSKGNLQQIENGSQNLNCLSILETWERLNFSICGWKTSLKVLWHVTIRFSNLWLSITLTRSCGPLKRFALLRWHRIGSVESSIMLWVTIAGRLGR